MRVSRFSCALAHILAGVCMLAFVCPVARAQSVDGSGGGQGVGDSPTGSSPNAMPGGALPGGGAMADFSTLINLIEQTIDPDSWLNAGGTSSIQQYPAGVYVDPAGQMRRVSTASFDTSLSAELSGSPRHPWKTQSAMRTISLKRLDAALSHTRQHGLRPSSDLLQLAGLSRIQYVRIDAANEDVLIAGPAGDTAFGFTLEDVAVVAALVNHQTTPLGCSIEPSDAGIRAGQRMLAQGNAIQELARSPQRVVEQLQQTIGPHNVRVFGMDAGTGTAIALLDADEHMKRVGFGTVDTEPRIRSYFDFLDRQASVPEQSLIRWWFAYDDSKILANSERNLFQLPEQCVRVMSEQQWVTGQGRAPTGKQDPAADAFAAEMTKHIGELRRSKESYSRLAAVFETALAMQLTLEATGQPSLAAWFPNLCGLQKSEHASLSEPKTVEGLTTWHKMKNGTIVAVVSGGVKVDTLALADASKWEESRFLASSLVHSSPTRVSTAHSNWWWD